MMKTSFVRLSVAALLAGGLSGCVPGLQGGLPMVQVPTFKTENLRLSGLELPFGGQGAVLLSTDLVVNNPNAFGLSLEQVSIDVILNGQKVTDLSARDIRIAAGGTSVTPTQVRVPLNLNGAAELLNIARGGRVPYRLDGTFTVDAGPFGKPTFGPMTLNQGVWQQPAILPF